MRALLAKEVKCTKVHKQTRSENRKYEIKIYLSFAYFEMVNFTNRLPSSRDFWLYFNRWNGNDVKQTNQLNAIAHVVWPDAVWWHEYPSIQALISFCIASFLVFRFQLITSFWVQAISFCDFHGIRRERDRDGHRCYAHTVSITRRLATNGHFNLKKLSAKHVPFHYSWLCHTGFPVRSRTIFFSWLLFNFIE